MPAHTAHPWAVGMNASGHLWVRRPRMRHLAQRKRTTHLGAGLTSILNDGSSEYVVLHPGQHPFPTSRILFQQNIHTCRAGHHSHSAKRSERLPATQQAESTYNQQAQQDEVPTSHSNNEKQGREWMSTPSSVGRCRTGPCATGIPGSRKGRAGNGGQWHPVSHNTAGKSPHPYWKQGL